jgi:hypothetical protein
MVKNKNSVAHLLTFFYSNYDFSSLQVCSYDKTYITNIRGYK